MEYILLAAYFTALFTLGYLVLKLFPLVFPKAIGWMSMMLMGIVVGVPMTYFFSCVFASTRAPLQYGILSFIGVLSVVFAYYLKTKKWRKNNILEEKINSAELAVIGTAVLFGCWMMWKTLRVGGDATWLVSRNTVFDTAHALSLVRSFSFGNNIPFTSPFAAGFSELYHFLFYFLVGLIEHSGIPLVFAFNAVSAFGFASYLVIGFYVMYTIFGKSKMIGFLTVVFLITHSTVTWWYFLVRHTGLSVFSALWHIQDYIFAGPYDGSVISLFFTLNVFVNQRHLAFAIASGYIVFLIANTLATQKKISGWVSGLLGGIIGVLFFWNLVVTVTVLGVVLLTYGIHKKYQQILWCCLGFFVVALTTNSSYVPVLWNELVHIHVKGSGVQKSALWAPAVLAQISYWISNLGLGSIACGIGCIYMKKRDRKIFLPMGILFVFTAIGFWYGKNEIAQKMLNFWNVAFVGISASGVWFLWKKGKIYRLLSLVLFFGMIASGIIDLFVIKNDYLYPAISSETNKRITILHAALPKESIVLSYEEMFHDVAFAGNKQYHGFFAAPSMGNRVTNEKEIFDAKSRDELLQALGKTDITHIYIPKNPKVDFVYAPDIALYRKNFKILFEDDMYILFDVNSPVIQ